MYSFMSALFSPVLLVKLPHDAVCRRCLYPLCLLFWISPSVTDWLLYLGAVQLDLSHTVISGFCFLQYLALWLRLLFFLGVLYDNSFLQKVDGMLKGHTADRNLLPLLGSITADRNLLPLVDSITADRNLLPLVGSITCRLFGHTPLNTDSFF